MTTLLGPGDAVLAFDVGGTHVKSALVDSAGRILGVRRDATRRDAAHPGEAVAAQLAEIGEELRASTTTVCPVAAGVSVPGIVDEAARRAILSSNLGWRDAPIYELTTAALALPVAFGHDVRGAGAAELRLGAARGRSDAIVVTIGTGIAATIIVGGSVHAGGGYAGEIGHMVVDSAGVPCGCGGRGCLETVSSAAAIARRYTEATGTPVTGAHEVVERIGSGDAAASAVWDEAVAALGDQLQRLCAALSPEVVVIGGGLATAGELLLGPLRDRLAADASLQRRPDVVPSELGPDAGLIGAALAARDLAASWAAEERL